MCSPHFHQRTNWKVGLLTSLVFSPILYQLQFDVSRI
uniref:Uncharacterized protein n=1 Tax=Aegilops tauschii subsp. strangulata TaxID=200361 RepID=A0A453CXT3_AEGTS